MKEKKGWHFSLFFNRTYSCYFHSVTRKHTQSIVWTWKLNKGWILLKFQSPRTSLYPGKCMDSTVFFSLSFEKNFFKFKYKGIEFRIFSIEWFQLQKALCLICGLICATNTILNAYTCYVYRIVWFCLCFCTTFSLIQWINFNLF